MAGRPRNAVILTAEERDTLLRWTRSRTCSQARALRAQIVLACADEPTNTAVSQRLGISRDMVGKWRTRFLTERLAGLDEQPRPGRPPMADDDTVAHVLVRTLTPPPGARQAWSTRSMAVETGLSQSTVSRIWRTFHIQPGANGTAAAPRRAWSLPDHTEEVVGLFLAPPLCVLAVTARAGRSAAAFAPGSAADRGPASGRGREAPHVLAVASAFSALRGRMNTEAEPSTESPALRTFLDHVRQAAGDGVNIHLLASGLPESALRSIDGSEAAPPTRLHWHRAPSPEAWTGETRRILALGPRLPREPAAGLPGVRDALLTWCSTWTPGTAPFARTAAPRPLYDGTAICGPGNDSPTPESRALRHPEPPAAPQNTLPEAPPGAPITTDPVVGLLREALLTGPYQPGDRVREEPLAARFDVTRRHIREALRTLAEEGMLDRLPNGGTAIPPVTAKDVLDLYSLRATLGALLIRRVAMLGPERLAPVSAALAEVRAASRVSDQSRIREEDLRFQDALARIADLPQAAGTFEHLTARLRMFVNVLHMDYTQAGHLIAQEDTAVFDALLKADGNEAARLWRVKIERCVRYMIAQLPQDHDPRLWTTLAGRPHPRQGDPRAAAR